MQDYIISSLLGGNLTLHVHMSKTVTFQVSNEKKIAKEADLKADECAATLLKDVFVWLFMPLLLIGPLAGRKRGNRHGD